jgi:hypothetical protein
MVILRDGISGLWVNHDHYEVICCCFKITGKKTTTGWVGFSRVLNPLPEFVERESYADFPLHCLYRSSCPHRAQAARPQGQPPASSLCACGDEIGGWLL